MRGGGIGGEMAGVGGDAMAGGGMGGMAGGGMGGRGGVRYSDTILPHYYTYMAILLCLSDPITSHLYTMMTCAPPCVEKHFHITRYIDKGYDSATCRTTNTYCARPW